MSKAQKRIQMHWTEQSLLVVVGITILLSFPNSSQAKPAWKEKFDEANSLELRHQNQQAFNLYQSALKALPPDEENTRAKILCSLASSMMALKHYDKAFSYGDDAAQLTRKLKEQKKLDPDVLLSLQFLLELCVYDSKQPQLSYEEKHLYIQKLMKLSLTLKQLLNVKDSELFDQRMMYARTFVALHKDDEAEKELIQFLNEMNPGFSGRHKVRLALAGLQAKHGRVSKFELEYLSNHKPQVEAMRKLAEGKFWAADYKGARDILDKALVKLGPTRPETVREEAEVNELYATMSLDCNDYKNAEPYARRSVALLSKYSNDRGDLRKAQWLLAEVLKGQKKYAEAAALEGPQFERKDRVRKERYDFMLTDEERAALAKEKAKTGRPSK